VKREPPANLPPAPPPGSLVQMQFDNIELRDLIRFVSNIMGKNFVFDESIVKGKVTVLSPKSLTRDEVFRVFESVLNYQGFAVVPTGEALKIVRAADAKGLAIETLDREALGKKPPEEKVATMVYPLEYLDSNTMVGILRPLMARDAYLVSVPTTNSLIMIDTEANLQRLNQVITEIDVPVSKQLSGIDVYNVQHTNAGDLAKVLQSLLAEGKKAAAPKEKVFITAYAPTNSLLVSAPPEDMKEIRRIIDEVDTFRPQVLVEAAIIEVSVTKGQSLGVEWLTGARSGNGAAVVGGSIAPVSPLLTLGAALTNTDSAAAVAAAASAISPGLNLGVVGPTVTWRGKEYNSVAAFVQAVATEDSVNILSTPQILTMNNEEAEVVVGENRPYLTSTRLDTAGNPINTYDYRDVGVKLKVKPYINKDGLVYLNLYQEVTQVTQATVGSGPNVQPAPTTLKRSTKTTVGVKDAQTIVISGLIRDDSTGNRTGIPILSSIPLLGWLFGSRTTTSEKTNLLVFITPRIVYTAEALQQLSNAKKAEQQRLIKRDK
jgi:general secretion pathway protein D